MKDLYSIAVEIATEGHKGQKRSDAKDYITHPIAAAESLEVLFPKYFKLYPRHAMLIKVITVAHDLAEDTNIKELEFVERLFGDSKLTQWSSDEPAIIYKALKILNKDNHSSYLTYILSCAQGIAEGPEFTSFPKQADLNHNLSDLKKGTLRDKYLLAQHILKR